MAGPFDFYVLRDLHLNKFLLLSPITHLILKNMVSLR